MISTVFVLATMGEVWLPECHQVIDERQLDGKSIHTVLLSADGVPHRMRVKRAYFLQEKNKWARWNSIYASHLLLEMRTSDLVAYTMLFPSFGKDTYPRVQDVRPRFIIRRDPPRQP